jgi:lipopolysaccharide transport system ATP-binding protein
VGQAVIHGRIGSLLEVGTGFHEELTGLENIYLNATILGMKREEIDQRLDDIIAFSGVEKFIKTPVKYYSSGMKMRLAFSVAAYIEPEVMLIDEVLAVGDAAFQQKCLQRVEGLTSTGRTVLFVSHSMDSVRRFCNRVIWLESGRIVMDGPAREVTDAYLAEVTQIKSSKQWLIEEEIPPSRQNGAGKDQIEPPAAEAEPIDSAVSLGGTDSIAAAPSKLSPKTPALEDLNSEPIPGSEYVRLVAVRVVNREGQPIVSISADQPVGIEVSYDVLIQEKLLLPAFRFYSERGVHLFTAVYTDPEYMQRIKPVGRYRSTVWIPGHFLNIGTISVSTTITTPGPRLERHCVVENAVSFHVTEVPFGIADAKGLYREVPGAVRPKFTWETQAELTQLLLDPSELEGRT